MLGPEIERLIQLLAKLPGLGPRSARRAVLHLLARKDGLMAPLAARQQVAEQDLRDAVDAHPLVRAAKEAFPGAEIRSVRQLTPPAPETDEPAAAAADDFDGDQAR